MARTGQQETARESGGARAEATRTEYSIYEVEIQWSLRLLRLFNSARGTRGAHCWEAAAKGQNLMNVSEERNGQKAGSFVTEESSLCRIIRTWRVGKSASRRICRPVTYR